MITAVTSVPPAFVRKATPPPQRRAVLPVDALQRTAVTQAATTAKTPLVTGNGYGFAVYDPAKGGISQFLIHPYRFMKPGKPKQEGIPTPDVIDFLGWKSGAKGSQYLDESQVMAAGEERFFMPFGLNRPALVTTGPGKLEVRWKQKVQSRTRLDGAWVIKLQSVKETMVMVPLKGQGWAIVSVEDPKEVKAAIADVQKWQGETPAGELAAREAGEMERWRVTPTVKFNSPEERRLWRQSETVMRMGQVREPNGPGRSGSGLILASLPAGEFFIAWVRDMAYATVALSRMGHKDEARKALDAMLNAQGVGKMRGPNERDYQVSTVRYFGDGSEEADYSDKPRPNVEYDSWGLALWAAGEYVKRSGDVAWLQSQTRRGTVYNNLREFVVAPLLDKLEPHGDGLIVAADTSVWEQNDAKPKHYAFTTIAAIAGLRSFLDLARASGDEATVKRVEEKLALLEKGLLAAFVKDGQLEGSLEPSARNKMDGALLEAINLGVIKDPKLINSVLDRMKVLLTSSGGYRRVTGSTGYELQEFVFINYALARALRSQGRTAEAAAIEKRMVEKAAANQSLMPEMYLSVPGEDFEGKIGSPTGATPMVGYGAGVFMMSLLER